MKRLKLKNKSKHNKRRILIILFFFFLFSIFFLSLFIKISNYINDFFLSYAAIRIENISSTIINDAVSDDLAKDLEFSNLYQLTKNSNNEIEMIDYNTVMVNQFLNEVTNNIQDKLFEVENKDDGVVFDMPLGLITNNPFLNNSGPKIPVKMKLVGSVLTNIKTTIKEYGINNSLIEISINVEVRQQVILPTVSKIVLVDNDVPLSIKIINGSIPKYYGSSIGANSGIMLNPLEEE